MTLKKSDMRKPPRADSDYERLIKAGITYPDYKDKTAWVLGAGNSLLDVWDWEVPENVIVFTMNSSILWAWKHWEDNHPIGITMKGNSCHSLNDYRRQVDYWFARDLAVFTNTYEPEKWYSNIAMRHPNLNKMIDRHCHVNYKFPGIQLMLCEPDWQSKPTLNVPHKHKLMAGPTVMLAVLHFVYRCGIKKIVLSGADFCRVKNEPGSKYPESRRFMDRLGIRKNHEHGDIRCTKGNMIKDTTGNWVYQESMMQTHMNVVNDMVRAMEAEGCDFYKTSPVGMLAVKYIDSEKTLQGIAKGLKLKYIKV